MAQITLKTAWERVQVLAYPRFLRTAFTNLNTMLTELYAAATDLSTTMQTSAPTTGSTVVCTDTNDNAHLVLTPAGTIATLTVTLPTNANSSVGQRVTISSSAEITALTVSGSGLTVTRATLPLAAGGAITYQKTAANAWRNISTDCEKEECISVPINLHATKTIHNIFTARRALRVLSIEYTPDIAQGGALTATVVKATGTATPASGTTPMHTAAGIDLNATAHTVQPITLSSTVADLALVAGERISFVESGAMTVGSGNVSIRYRHL